MAPGLPVGHGPAGAGQNQTAADNSLDVVTNSRDLRRGINPLAALGKPLGPATATFKSTRAQQPFLSARYQAVSPLLPG